MSRPLHYQCETTLILPSGPHLYTLGVSAAEDVFLVLRVWVVITTGVPLGLAAQASGANGTVPQDRRLSKNHLAQPVRHTSFPP